MKERDTTFFLPQTFPQLTFPLKACFPNADGERHWSQNGGEEKRWRQISSWCYS